MKSNPISESPIVRRRRAFFSFMSRNYEHNKKMNEFYRKYGEKLFSGDMTHTQAQKLAKPIIDKAVKDFNVYFLYEHGKISPKEKKDILDTFIQQANIYGVIGRNPTTKRAKTMKSNPKKDWIVRYLSLTGNIRFGLMKEFTTYEKASAFAKKLQKEDNILGIQISHIFKGDRDRWERDTKYESWKRTITNYKHKNTAVRMDQDFDDPEWKSFSRKAIKRRKGTKNNPKKRLPEYGRAVDIWQYPHYYEDYDIIYPLADLEEKILWLRRENRLTKSRIIREYMPLMRKIAKKAAKVNYIQGSWDKYYTDSVLKEAIGEFYDSLMQTDPDYWGDAAERYEKKLKLKRKKTPKKSRQKVGRKLRTKKRKNTNPRKTTVKQAAKSIIKSMNDMEKWTWDYNTQGPITRKYVRQNWPHLHPEDVILEIMDQLVPERDKIAKKWYSKKRKNTTIPGGSSTGGGYMHAMRGLREGDYSTQRHGKQLHMDYLPVGYSSETGRDVVDTALVAGKKINPRKRKYQSSKGWYKFSMLSKTGKNLGIRVGIGNKTEANNLGKRYLGKKVKGRIVHKIVIDGPYKNKPMV